MWNTRFSLDFDQIDSKGLFFCLTSINIELEEWTMETIETIKRIYDLINFYKDCQMVSMGINIEIFECMSKLLDDPNNKHILEEIENELINIGIWK